MPGRGGPRGPPPAPGGGWGLLPLRPDARLICGGSPGTCTPNALRRYLFSRQAPRLAGRLPYSDWLRDTSQLFYTTSVFELPGVYHGL